MSPQQFAHAVDALIAQQPAMHWTEAIAVIATQVADSERGREVTP